MCSSHPFCMMTVLVFNAHPDYKNFDGGRLFSGTFKYAMISAEGCCFLCDIIKLHLEMCCLHKEASLVALVCYHSERAFIFLYSSHFGGFVLGLQCVCLSKSIHLVKECSGG